MKTLLSIIVLLSAQSSFALDPEVYGECVVTNQNNLQFIIGLVQPLVADQTVDGQALQNLILSDSVSSCQEAEIVLAEAYVAGLKKKLPVKASK
ncbi:MAG: hypothetical protein IT287_05240 [Bdellovibrionaceae bacterium]|nr:hypothetical protein [Pseudobdellovibrionaceae bacterium]